MNPIRKNRSVPEEDKRCFSWDVRAAVATVVGAVKALFLRHDLWFECWPCMSAVVQLVWCHTVCERFVLSDQDKQCKLEITSEGTLTSCLPPCTLKCDVQFLGRSVQILSIWRAHVKFCQAISCVAFWGVFICGKQMRQVVSIHNGQFMQDFPAIRLWQCSR